MVRSAETSGTTKYYTWISKIHGPVAKNLGDEEAIDVDYLKHGPVLKNIEDAEVIYVDY